MWKDKTRKMGKVWPRNRKKAFGESIFLLKIKNQIPRQSLV